MSVYLRTSPLMYGSVAHVLKSSAFPGIKMFPSVRTHDPLSRCSTERLTVFTHAFSFGERRSDSPLSSALRCAYGMRTSPADADADDAVAGASTAGTSESTTTSAKDDADADDADAANKHLLLLFP